VLLQQQIAVPAALPGRWMHHASAGCRIRMQPNDAVSAHYASRRVITGCPAPVHQNFTAHCHALNRKQLSRVAEGTLRFSCLGDVREF
jgi:hypothetical protein